MFDPDRAIGSRRGRVRRDKGNPVRAGNSLLSYSPSSTEETSSPVTAPPREQPPGSSGKSGLGGWLRGARQRLAGRKPVARTADAATAQRAENTADTAPAEPIATWDGGSTREDEAYRRDTRFSASPHPEHVEGGEEDRPHVRPSPSALRGGARRGGPHDDSQFTDDSVEYERERDAYWKPLIDPTRVIAGIVRARWIIVATTILGALAGVLIALATPKHYYSATELLFDPRDLQFIDRELTRGALPSDATLALIENQVSLITSGTVLGNVVDELDLTDDPEFNGQGGSMLGLLLNPRALLSFGGEGKSTEATRRSLAINHLADSLDVSRVERTFVIRIGVTTLDPEKSALIATTTADAFLEASSALQAGTAGRANSEIMAQLDEMRAEVEATERAVAEYKAENDLVDAQGRLITEDELVRLNDQLTTARARTNELEARAESADTLDVNTVLGGSLPEQVASPVMTELMAQYTAIRQQADSAEARLGPLHPQSRVVGAELAGAREAIAAELQRVVASIRVELQRARSLEQELSSRLAGLKAEMANREDNLVTLRELQREAEARRSVYEALLLRARETGQQRFLNTANVSIISPAYVPLLPSGPSRASIAIAGTVLGFLLGVLIGAGMGAIASLREGMGSGQGRRPRDDHPGRSRRNHDPNPPPPGGGRPTPDEAPHAHTRAQAEAPSRPRPYPSSDRDIDPAWRAEQESLEDIRRSLRAFRAEVDALAEERTRRAG